MEDSSKSCSLGGEGLIHLSQLGGADIFGRFESGTLRLTGFLIDSLSTVGVKKGGLVGHLLRTEISFLD